MSTSSAPASVASRGHAVPTPSAASLRNLRVTDIIDSTDLAIRDVAIDRWFEGRSDYDLLAAFT